MEIPVKSATYAMKGKQLLHQNGIGSHVGKRSGEAGCYYYLNVLIFSGYKSASSGLLKKEYPQIRERL